MYTNYYSEHYSCRLITISYTVPMFAIVLLKAMTPIVESSSIQLPVDAWYPYSIKKVKWFWTTYLHIMMMGCACGCIHVGLDTLFIGLLLNTSSQISILEYRLRKIRNSGNNIEKKMIIECIHHQEYIYRYIW